MPVFHDGRGRGTVETRPRRSGGDYLHDSADHRHPLVNQDYFVPDN